MFGPELPKEQKYSQLEMLGGSGRSAVAGGGGVTTFTVDSLPLTVANSPEIQQVPVPKGLLINHQSFCADRPTISALAPGWKTVMMSKFAPGPDRQLVGSSTSSMGTEKVGVMVATGPLLAGWVGELAGRVVRGVSPGPAGAEAFNVIATKVAAWSSSDGSENMPGKLQAESNSRREINPARANLGILIGYPYLGRI
jgi:hypothetical protein